MQCLRYLGEFRISAPVEWAIPHTNPVEAPMTNLVPPQECVVCAVALLLTLDLVVTGDNLGVARGRVVAASFASIVVLRLGSGGCRGRACFVAVAAGAVAVVVVARGAVVHTGLWLGRLSLPLAVVGMDKDICYAPAFVLRLERLVLVFWLGEFGNDVPRVEEARNLEHGISKRGHRRSTTATYVA